MQTEERHRHAFDCYNVTCKRCGALLQWINQVSEVNKSIRTYERASCGELESIIRLKTINSIATRNDGPSSSAAL